MVSLAGRQSSERTNDLDLDVDLDKCLGERIDLDEAWVYRSGEPPELGNQTYLTLLHRFVRVGKEDATGNGTQCPKDRTQSVDHAAIPAMRRCILAARREHLRVRWLQVFISGRFHAYKRTSVLRGPWSVSIELAGVAAAVRTVAHAAAAELAWS